MKLDRHRLRKQVGALEMLAVLLLIAAGFEWYVGHHFGVPASFFSDVNYPLGLACVGAVAFYSGAILAAMHPMQLFEARFEHGKSDFLTNYFRFLLTTPWRPGTDLPLGNHWPVWQDVPFLATIEIVSEWYVGAPPGMALVIFAAGYSLPSMLILLMVKSFLPVYILLMLLPGIAWLKARIGAIDAIALIAVAIVWYAIRASLWKYPWGWEKPRRPKVDLGWPMGRVGPSEPFSPIPVPAAIAICLLPSWYFYSAIALDESITARDAWQAIVVASLWLAMVRLVIYLVRHFPPISFWGRIATGRLIIPRYDQMVVAPLAAVLAAWFCPQVFGLIGLNAKLAAALGGFCVLMILLKMGPSFRDFELTGAYRMPRASSRLVNQRSRRSAGAGA